MIEYIKMNKEIYVKGEIMKESKNKTILSDSKIDIFQDKTLSWCNKLNEIIFVLQWQSDE